MNQKRNSSSSL